ncbi:MULTISPECIES: Bax inhibitor-1/YccA family protein [Flammeovirga]|uniref:Bax inhibitor-1/YccA family protein n=1 Tax=Flammeovirga agarivorans TaxID=2726742 RepID=A0A7X8SMU0_9BACT|nr:Bax inhibitor-1/YccA family protein [Flammeovirga agarivorans]
MRETNYQSYGRYQHSEKDVINVQNSFMTKVYGWMSGGLAITAATSMFIANSYDTMMMVANMRWILIIAQLGLVFALSGAINRMSSATATILFLAYSALTGATLSSIFYVYDLNAIVSTFFVTAGTFVAMSVYGMTTKKDLSSMGSLLMMALLGLIITSIVNIFIASSTLYWLISGVGVLIFVGLIAYDTQKLKEMSHAILDGESAKKMVILGALSLYLDFINLFLFLLRFFGGSSRD